MTIVKGLIPKIGTEAVVVSNIAAMNAVVGIVVVLVFVVAVIVKVLLLSEWLFSL